MPLLNLITEIIPKKTEILITHPASSLGTELTDQLSSYNHVSVIPVTSAEEFPQTENLGAIIHLAGFDKPSLSHTLSHTTTLHSLLVLSRKTNSKFILVVPNVHSHLYHTAVSLVTEFAKSHPIQYVIIEIDKTSPVSDVASEIVKKIIYAHQKPIKNNQLVAKTPGPTKHTIKLDLNLKKLSLSLVFLIGFPYLIYFSQLITSLLLLYCTFSQSSALSFNLALRCSEANSKLLKVVQFENNLIPGASRLSQQIGLPTQETSILIDATQEVLLLLTQTVSTGQRIFTHTYYSSTSPTSQEKQQLTSLLTRLSESAANLQTQFKLFYLSSKLLSNQLDNFAQQVVEIRHTVVNLEYLVDNIEYFLGKNRKTNYAILIQDNTELKPSGGVIDTVILATLENSKVTQIQTTTAKALDSQLVGSVQSSSDFQTITGKTTWKLVDSNWEPDHSSSARRTAWFIEKESSFSPDIIVSVNFNYLKQLLEITGKIPSSTSHQTITSINFLDTYLNSLNKEPSSNTFTYDLTSKLIEKSNNFKPEQITTLLLKTVSQLNNHEIYLYPLSLSLEKTGFDWAGETGPTVCMSIYPCVSEKLGIFDTNISNNKTDPLIKKEATIESQLTSTLLLNTISLHYENLNQQKSWPYGNHKNYLRLILSPETSVNEMYLNDEKLSLGSYKTTQTSLGTQVSIEINTPYKSNSSLKIVTSKPLTIRNRVHYNLQILKQPGANSYLVNQVISYPKSWFALSYSKASVASPGSLQYNTQITSPKVISIDFNPND